MVILDYYSLLPTREDKAAFRDEVIRRTGISFSSFWRKLREDSWRTAERKLIETLIEESYAAER